MLLGIEREKKVGQTVATCQRSHVKVSFVCCCCLGLSKQEGLIILRIKYAEVMTCYERYRASLPTGPHCTDGT